MASIATRRRNGITKPRRIWPGNARSTGLTNTCVADSAVTTADCKGALRASALGVCDYLAETTGCPSQLARIPLEGSIIPVVEGMFKEGLAHHGLAPGVDGALLATTAAWAVFGAARRWFQTPNRIPAEEMAARIETMVSPVLFGASQ